MGLALAFLSNEAGAAALGGFATSVGLFGAVAALFVVKGWPVHLQASMLSTAGGALVVACGAAWLWRSRLVGMSGMAALRRDPAIGHRSAAAPMYKRMHTRTRRLELPPGLDVDALIADLRNHFMRLQAAWDSGEMPALSALTTPEMLAELHLGLPGSTATRGCCHTEVVALEVELLGFDVFGDEWLVGAEFSGAMRDATQTTAAPFRELWMLTCSKAGHSATGSAAESEGSSGWQLARHQALF